MNKALSLAVVVGLASSASATVLLGNQGQPYSAGNGAAIGGSGIFGVESDLQVAHPFSIADPYFIDKVAGDWLTFFGGTPLQGALIEFFPDVGGKPDEAPFAAYTAGMGEISTSGFADGVFGLVGVTMSVDMTASGILLPADTWWVSIQPIAIGGDWGYVAVNGANPSGIHVRDGGFAHGNGYAGGYGVNVWTPIQGVGFADGAASYTVEGTIIPAPGAVALLGLAGLAARRRR